MSRTAFPLRAAGAVVATAAVTAVSLVAVLTASPAHAKGGEAGGSGSTYYLNDSWSGKANHTVTFGQRTNKAYVGDWNGDGVDNLAVRDGNRYWLTDANGEPADWEFTYGRASDVTLMGDWDGDGVDTPAVRRGSVYHFANDVSSGPADAVITYGRASDQVLVGDWNADGQDTLAVRRGNRFFFADRLTGGEASRVVAYGRATDLVYVGDWDGDGVDTPAVRRGATYYVTDRFAPGDAARVLTYGRPTDKTMIGDWNGDGRDTLGVRRDEAPVLSAAAAWARAEYGTFAPAGTSGDGADEFLLPDGVGAGLLTATSWAGGEFRIELVTDEETPQVIEVPVSATTEGGYITTAPFGLSSSVAGSRIRVTATGGWTLKLQPLESAPLLPENGVWDGVYLYGGPASDVAVLHDGTDVFTVTQWSGDDAEGARPIVETSGPYSGTASLGAGPSLVYVVATGAWSLTPQ